MDPPLAPPTSQPNSTTPKRPRRTTTHTSPHFPSSPPSSTPSPLKRLRTRHTPSKSPHFSSTPPKLPRPYHARLPPLTAPRFGLIQEELAHTPFHLLLAVILLNQTSGRAAVPVLRRIIARFPSIADIGDEANHAELEAMVRPLGLKRRAGVMGKLARGWMEDPPRRGRRWSLRGRNRDYPTRGAGAEVKVGEVLADEEEVVEVWVEGEEAELHEEGTGEGEGEGGKKRRREWRRDERTAALEIGHLAGCGAYAWDSWRIFCRDELRGKRVREWILKRDGTKSDKVEDGDVSEDLEGVRRYVDGQMKSDFEEEWKRVLPKDKELRPFLAWMWLKEGWIWDPDTGFKEKASDDLMERAQNDSIEWLEELRIWREDLAKRQIVLGDSVRPTQGKIEGPKKSYLEMLSSSGSSDELSDVPSDEDLEQLV
ncbi:hypothetical protein EV356DRAFT_563205 [Viridothelium virens]|uniref:DNA glycosylase n=1 Tax=Viridothelium virens TaxID=1048519 RepID=A0A6A6HMM7_VIRVR|nr:hypothetical protein EV356DRAFT_563205 [Viridothelium virens]